MHVWLDAFPEDFRDPPDYPLLKQFLQFCERQAKDTELHFKVKHRMERLLKHLEADTGRPPSALQRILSSPTSVAELSFTPDGSSSPARVLRNGSSPAGLNGLNHSMGGGGGGDHLNESSLHAVFLDMHERHMAEQLTRLDTVRRRHHLIIMRRSFFYLFSSSSLFVQELFKRVIPHQCLGAVWSRREKLVSGGGGKGTGSRASEASTVAATVEQFNAVSYRVISTVLLAGTAQQRARIVGKWIDVAQELRVLKNFSSLKAIISALQCNPIYRLKHIWVNVPKDKVELDSAHPNGKITFHFFLFSLQVEVYEELARIFSEENNQSAQRELLMKEGTAKVISTLGFF